MFCCKAHELGNWCEDAPLVAYKDEDNNAYCIFHAPAEHKGINNHDFNKLVTKRIMHCEAHDVSCDFSGTIFPGSLDFSKAKFTQDVDFNWAWFTQNADFRGAKFTQDVHLSDVRFTQDVDFSRAMFAKDANFWEAKFGQNANFSRVKFTQNADFYKATFTQNADFRGAKFAQNADFYEATFTQNADFRGAKVAQNADFYKATFTQNADFKGAKFAKDADFRKAKFMQDVNFCSTTFNKADYYGDAFNGTAMFDLIQIKDRLRFHNVNLKRAAFRHADLGKCEFITCKWNGKGGRYSLYDETVFRDDLNMWRFRGDDNKVSERVHEIEDLYRQMKQKSQDEHNMYDYSFWHCSEKEMMWLRTRLVKSPFQWAVLGTYRLFSGFGEEPLKAFGFLFLFVLMSGWLIGSNGGPEGIEPLATETMKHLTFIKIKEPLIIPNTFGGLATVLVTRILVPLQAALFGFALRNRFRR